MSAIRSSLTPILPVLCRRTHLGSNIHKPLRLTQCRMLTSQAPLPTKLVSIKEMRANIAAFRRKNPDATVGFVPTMGALHAGHLTIVTQAKIECDYVVASLFVNPAQFAANEDYDIYPRPIEEDMKLLGQEGVDAVFVPTTQEIYGDKNALEEGTAVEVRGLSHQLEGAIRPHFFRGVATVVSKLLNIVQPDFIYLGQKDAQQAVVVRNMIKDMHIPSELRVIQTVREKDGLAMSSRNAYLNEAQRAVAPLLYQAMGEALRLYVHEKERSTKVLLDAVKEYIRENGNELTELQYISINDTESLYEVETIGKQGALLSGALLLGEIRIIDNIILR